MNRIKAILAALVMIAAGLTITSTPVAASARPVSPTVAVKGYPPVGNVTSKGLCTGACYYYNIGSQQPTTPQEGVYSNNIIGKPGLDSADYHSLMEISVQKDGTNNNRVEFGWTVDRVVNGSCTPSPACKDNPYLFGYWAKNGVGQGYNAVTGWTDNASNPINLGSSLGTSVGSVKKFGIQYDGGKWWLWYDTDWVGYYAETNWTSTMGLPGSTTPVVGGFPKFGFYQTFAELASVQNTPSTICSDMGNGLIATVHGGPPSASRWSGTVTQLLGVNTNGNLWYHDSPASVVSPYWVTSSTAANVAWMGGPGGC